MLIQRMRALGEGSKPMRVLCSSYAHNLKIILGSIWLLTETCHSTSGLEFSVSGILLAPWKFRFWSVLNFGFSY